MFSVLVDLLHFCNLVLLPTDAFFSFVKMGFVNISALRALILFCTLLCFA